jgi:hypothetical protein
MTLPRFAWIALVALAAGVLGSGCSSFGRDWKAATGQPAGEHGVAGRWEGEWVSDVNGHRGRLQAVVTPEGGPRYHVHYRATYRKLLRFSFGYEMSMDVEPAGQGACLLQGEADLGVWGEYRCEGSANGTHFTARYETQYDHGVFHLDRADP